MEREVDDFTSTAIAKMAWHALPTTTPHCKPPSLHPPQSHLLKGAQGSPCDEEGEQKRTGMEPLKGHEMLGMNN